MANHKNDVLFGGVFGFWSGITVGAAVLWGGLEDSLSKSQTMGVFFGSGAAGALLFGLIFVYLQYKNSAAQQQAEGQDNLLGNSDAPSSPR